MVASGSLRPVLSTVICFVMAVLAWGTVFYGHSVYMDALMREHGWSASLVSSAVLVFWIASLPGTLFVGMLVDRKGPVPVVAIGGLCIGGGLYLLGQITEHWQMYVIYAAMGFGYPALAAAAISATLTPWFDRGFGVALGIALTGASVGGAIVPPLMVQHSAVHGFDVTMTLAGTVVLAIVFAAVFLLYLVGRPNSPDRHVADAVPYSMLAIIGHWRFWAIAIPAALGLGGQVGLLAHQVPIIAMHIDQVSAAFMVTVVAISSAFGRLLVGLLSRYLSVTVLAALSYILHGTGIALLAVADTEVWILAACAVAGLTVGAIVMLPPLIVRHVYGTDGFGRTYAMVNVVMYVFAGLSPWMVGVLRDAMGDYSAALWMLVVLEVLAAGFILGALRYRSVGNDQS
ncbi:MAG: cyanate permease [Hyphomicrobiaceae bacterium]